MPRQNLLSTVLGFIALFSVIIGTPSPAVPAETTKCLPDKTMLVVSINVKQLLQSQLVRGGNGPLRPIIAEADKMLERIGLDADKDIDRILIALGEQFNARNLLVIVEGRFDSAKIHAGLKELAAKRKSEFQVFEEGGVSVFQGQTARPANSRQVVGLPDKFYLAVLDDTAIAIAADRSSMNDVIATKAGKRRSQIRARVTELVGKIAPTDSATLVFAPPDGLLTTASTVGLQTVVGSVVITDGIVTDVLVGAKDADVAKRLFDEINEGVQRLKDILPGLVADQPGVGRREQDFIREALGTIRVANVPLGVHITSTIPKAMIEKMSGPSK